MHYKPAFPIWVALILALRPSQAVCPEPHPKVCSEFFESDSVFVGTVLAEKDLPEQGAHDAGSTYQLRVRQTFRGSLGRTVQTSTERNSYGYYLDVGQTYLLFATRREDRLWINGCGNSNLLSGAGGTIAEIGKVRRGRGGFIEGQIQEFSGEYRPMSGIKVIAQGERKFYESSTGPDGWFRFEVPAGTYLVRPEPSANIIPSDLSYQDPDHIVIHDGGCGQVKFVRPR